MRWHDLEPRLGVAYDLFGNGKTALKASLNKYLPVLRPAAERRHRGRDVLDQHGAGGAARHDANRVVERRQPRTSCRTAISSTRWPTASAAP